MSKYSADWRGKKILLISHFPRILKTATKLSLYLDGFRYSIGSLLLYNRHKTGLNVRVSHIAQGYDFFK